MGWIEEGYVEAIEEMKEIHGMKHIPEKLPPLLRCVYFTGVWDALRLYKYTLPSLPEDEQAKLLDQIDEEMAANISGIPEIIEQGKREEAEK